MGAFDRLLGRTPTEGPTNNTVAAQERFHLWGTFLDRKIGELESLVGAGMHADASLGSDPAAGSSLGDPKPLNMAAFELVEG